MMRRITHHLPNLLAVFFATTFSLVAHTSALPVHHDMGSVEHGKSSSSTQVCVTLCRSVVFTQESVPIETNDEDDQKPEPIAYQYSTANNLKTTVCCKLEII